MVIEGRLLGRRILYFKEVSSTNDIALSLARQGYEEGTVIIAESQTKGRGRLGRSWLSKEGGIYLSLILRPKIDLDLIPLLTLLASVAVAKGIRRIFNLEASVKWPNDVLINNRKVCGILAEAELPSFVILGIGINANIEVSQFSKGFIYPATSLIEELKRGIDRERLIKEILVCIEGLYLSFNKDDIIKEWQRYRCF